MIKYIIITLLFFAVLIRGTVISQRTYDVHWLSDSISINSEKSGFKKNIDIYCYPGTEKNLVALWLTVKHVSSSEDEDALAFLQLINAHRHRRYWVHPDCHKSIIRYFKINLILENEKDDFKTYFGSSPEEVFKQYSENSYGWSVILQGNPSKSNNLELFNTTCVNFDTSNKHTIQLQIIRIDLWRILLMAAGLTIIFFSKAFSANHIFYYLCGILVGIFASFMILVYYIGKRLPQRGLTYGLLIGGWTFGVYVIQKIWENISSLVLEYQAAMFWYITIIGFLSFVICYRLGPPKDLRSQNLVMWTLQFIGATMIFFSSQYREASTAIFIVALSIKYLPRSWLQFFSSFWLRRFPPKVKLLTSEEYYEQGARETKDALENLRQYCSSPDCAQWRVILKLNDSKRFANFVEGNSHLSDDEVMDYESYAFSMERKRNSTVNSTVNSGANSTVNHLEISDDDSSDSDEDY